LRLPGAIEAASTVSAGALMDEFNVPAYKQYIDGEKYRYKGTIPLSMSSSAVANIGSVLLELTQMYKSIPSGR